MRIAEWSLHFCRLPYSRPVKWFNSIEDGAVLALLRLVGDDGAVGVAEAPLRPTWSGVSPRSLAAVLEDLLLPAVQEIDAGDAAAVSRQLARFPESFLAKMLIDNACWTLRAAAAGKPLWQLLGGQANVEVSWCVTRQPPEAMAREAAEIVDGTRLPRPQDQGRPGHRDGRRRAAPDQGRGRRRHRLLRRCQQRLPARRGGGLRPRHRRRRRQGRRGPLPAAARPAVRRADRQQRHSRARQLELRLAQGCRAVSGARRQGAQRQARQDRHQRGAPHRRPCPRERRQRVLGHVRRERARHADQLAVLRRAGGAARAGGAELLPDDARPDPARAAADRAAVASRLPAASDTVQLVDWDKVERYGFKHRPVDVRIPTRAGEGEPMQSARGVSAWRTGSCGGLSSCRTSCARPRGCRASGSRPS